MIRERALKLGRSAPLVGILSEPPPETASDARPCVLLLNSGILHRVGACRLHVRLARRLASEGCVVVRFDFSGIGDSDVRRDGLSYEENSVVELRETMDQLGRTRGLESFVPMGLCSGADMALEVAKVDERVRGLGLIDLWAYRTPGYYLRHYGPKLFDLGTWRHAIQVRLDERRAGAPDAPGEDLDLPTYVREFPPRAAARRDLAALAARRVRLCCIFSGGQPDHYNHQGQMRAAFRSVDFGDLLDERYIPGSDHIFTNLAHQRLVIDSISEWLQVH